MLNNGQGASLGVRAGRMPMFMARMCRRLSATGPYFTLLGLVLWVGTWWLLCEVFSVPRFEKMPGPVVVLSELFSPQPFLGVSVFTEEYYAHMWASCRRIFFAFCIATGVGVPLGLFMGWSRKFRDYTFPILEILRPIPILAWVPLAILMFKGFESPVIFLATLASLYVSTLNTLLGVDSIDESYFRAAGCLGSKPHHIFWHVVVPGALPFMFTGLQISIGVAWFSLVAAEMVSGDWGLGYLIVDAYMNNVTVPMVIGMITLGFVGWFTSVLVRIVGDRMMQWRTRALAMENR
ncbi:MAG: ABC transporter permease [Gammaproteobacteria bacterium]|nr:ABC transporter permease [Gammaproteobacteria bacterium]